MARKVTSTKSAAAKEETAVKKEAAAKAGKEEAVKEVEKEAASKEETGAKSVKEESSAKEEAASKEVKPAAEETAETKKTPAKKAPAKKTPAKKKEIEKVEEVYIQFQELEITTKDVLERAKKAYVAEGHRESSIKSIRLYIKPEESMAYYVINDKFAGGVAL